MQNQYYEDDAKFYCRLEMYLSHLDSQPMSPLHTWMVETKRPFAWVVLLKHGIPVAAPPLQAFFLYNGKPFK